MCCMVVVVSALKVNWKWRNKQEIRGFAGGDELEGSISKDHEKYVRRVCWTEERKRYRKKLIKRDKREA